MLHHVAVLEGAAEWEAGLDENPVERGQRFVVDHDGHLVVLRVDEPLPHFRFGDLAAEHARLAVGGIRFEVVAQRAFQRFKGMRMEYQCQYSTTSAPEARWE